MQITVGEFPVVVTLWTGGNALHEDGVHEIPLQFSVQLTGSGSWDYGSFSGTSAWSPWLATNRPARPIFPDINQTLGMEIKAQAYRNGVADVSGSYVQSPALTISVSAAPWIY